MRGTLDWTGGDTRVLWKNQRGFSDLATVKVVGDQRTVEWSTSAPIPRRPGVTQITIRALGEPAAEEFVNVYYTVQSPPALPRHGTTMFKGRQIEYEEIDGRAVYQSDMILGSLDDVRIGKFAGRMGEGGMRIQPRSATIAPNLTYTSGLWPIVNGVVRVPYTMTSVNATNINSAIAEANSQLAGVLQWAPATGSDVNLVNFNFNPGDLSGTCEAIVGMQGSGSLPINGSGICGVNTILHEMGHAVGLYHEQSRSDRNTWVTYNEGQVDKPQGSNFDIAAASTNSGLFNYASIMEYSPFLFARYGVSPVLETIPAGMVLGSTLPQYTTGDLDGIKRLYGFTPSVVTVDTNPTGLALVVDGTACTAPCTFNNWTLGSSHTLVVSQTIQTLSGHSYLFGRWNSDLSNTQSATASIVNSAGNGSLLSPTTSPAITNYLASFTPIHPYGPSISANHGQSGSAAGTLTTSPAPFNAVINSVSTNYFKDRQFINLTAAPKTGFTFYLWANVALPMFYAGSMNLYLTSDLGSSVTAFFVDDVVTTVTGSSPDLVNGIYPGFFFGVVENSRSNQVVTAFTPRNFDVSQDGAGFAAASQITLCGSGLSGTTCPATPVTQSPVTTNMNYLNYSWNGATSGSTNALSVTIPSNGGQYNLNLSYNFRDILLPSISSQFCPGIAINTSPAPAINNGTGGAIDAFYPENTGIATISVTGGAGVGFVGWSGDLSGSANPYQQTFSNQLVATANFNVTGTTGPLTVTGVSWTGSPAATNNAVNLVVTGTGFVTNGNTYAYFGVGGGSFAYRPFTVQSSTQLTMQLTAGDLNTVGYNQILVLNTGVSGCNPEIIFTFGVSDSNGAPALSISKSHTGVFGPGQQGAQYTILVTNTGTAGVTLPVTVTDTLPSGETLVSMAGANGSGWSCNTQTTPPSCTNSNVLAPAASYGLITVTVNVAANATSPQVNSASVSGGGAEQATATDSTVIQANITTPNVVGQVLATAENNLTTAGLTIGTVMGATSPTVASGQVISTTPAAGNVVAPGTAVDITYSVGTTASLVSIAVTPSSPSIAKGLTQQFAATGTYNDNSTNSITGQVTWASGTSATATISTTGLATGAGIGTSSITAALSGVTSPGVTLTVTAAALVSIAVSPLNPSIPKGQTQQFTATGTYTDNSTQPLTTQVTWVSATQATATISATGLATGVGTGTSSITAALSGVTSPGVTLTVTAATLVSIAVTPASPSIAKGQTQQFTATGTYTDNSTQPLTTHVTWGSGTQATATISATGLATGVGTGTSNITAALSGVTSPGVTLTVTAATLVSITVTPANPSIVVGTAQQFTATGTYTDNSTAILASSVTWTSSNTVAATIVNGGGNTGKASGLAAGASNITAALSGVTSPAAVLTVTALGPCDLNQDGIFNLPDIQMTINQALGKNQPANDLNGDQVVNVVDFAIVTNSVLYGVCIQ